MSNQQLLRHKGYIGTAEMSFEDNCLFGKVLYINDLISYDGETPEELEQSFKAAVDGYLAFCAEIGKQPEITCSGNFNIRIDPTLHHACVKQAKLQHISLNQFIANCLEQNITELNANQQILDTLHNLKSDVVKPSQHLNYHFSPTNLRIYNPTAELPISEIGYFEHNGVC